MKISRALTIAGSDSGGGAGIQADLKTFAALQVHGMSAITSITAQNTVEVRAIQDIDPEVVKAQIDAVVDDIGVDAAKTGMLHASEIISAVAEAVERHRFPIVVDPVMIAKSEAYLIEADAMKTLIEELLPLATVVTPNIMEAEALTDMKIRSVDDAKDAAEKISQIGPKAVVVKGGHLTDEEKIVDILFYRGEYCLYEAIRLDSRNTHGTGCSFSAAIAAELAKGRDVFEALSTARGFISRAIRSGLNIGHGYGPVNPMAELYRDVERYRILEDVKKAVKLLEDSDSIWRLVPESQINLAMALPQPESVMDIAAISGRIVKIGKRVKASSSPEFGASRHIGNMLLVVMKYDPDIRAAMNIKYSEEILEAFTKLGFKISSYDRREEPEEVKLKEGMTTKWGADQAIRRFGGVPDIIYHEGDFGKEPMIIVLGRTAGEVAQRVLSGAEKIDVAKAGRLNLR